MDIVSLGNWTEDFTGAPTVASRLTLASAMDLHTLQNLRLIIETLGAHGNIFCRLENDSLNYVEFNMGGDRTGAGPAVELEQTLVKDLKAASFVQVTNDFNANEINSIYIYMVDDAAVAGTASVDKTSIALSYDSEVAHDIEFEEGFGTELQTVLGPSSTTIKTAHRPYNSKTMEPINETILVSSSATSRDLKDYSGVVKGRVYGEGTWVVFNSIHADTGVITWDIIHSGLNGAELPPNLGSIRNSLRMTHILFASSVMPLMKGLINEGVAQVNQRKDEIENLITGTVVPPSRLADGTVTALTGVTINSSEKLEDGNANFRGISRDGGTDVLITYDTYGQVSDGHTGLDPELQIFIEADGSIVQVATGTTLEVGFPLNDTQIWIYDIASIELASQAEAEGQIENTKAMSSLRVKQSIDADSTLARLAGDQEFTGINTFADDKARSKTNAPAVNDLSYVNKKELDDRIPADVRTVLASVTGQTVNSTTYASLFASFAGSLALEEYDELFLKIKTTTAGSDSQVILRWNNVSTADAHKYRQIETFAFSSGDTKWNLQSSSAPPSSTSELSVHILPGNRGTSTRALRGNDMYSEYYFEVAAVISSLYIAQLIGGYSGVIDAELVGIKYSS